MKKVIVSEKAPAAIGCYSHAIEAGNMVFTSGQLPIDAATGKMPETAAEQAKQSLENVKHILEAAGLTMDDTVKTTVYIKNISDFPAVNEVYATYFAKPFPARSCFEVGNLPLGALVEIEVIASR
ncbi:RidA family protein [Desulfovibrio gilichinskyi]|uniref:Endoribonuclease L-PSP n=1 Tax=Desulfovibrio gilichinskyi TaxID=1519643 RepID=A0A1X7EL48_9BACT|nr:RidA family protein [Desulfovibrio gilichinskyi]SMF35729.1 endoribonuclease L-PSP [Desulfovibrio gilichinskyi]